MNKITNENGAELIREYAQTTGNGFTKTKADLCKMMDDTLKVDVADAFDIAHVTIARLVEECKEVLHMRDDTSDKTYLALTIIMTIGMIMQTQHTIAENMRAVEKEAQYLPKPVRDKMAILASSSSIMQRSKELPQALDYMIKLFMSNVVKDLG